VRREAAQALQAGREGAELRPTLFEKDRELFVLASVLAPLTRRPEHRASSLTPLRALLGDELSEVYGLVKRVSRGDLTPIRRPASPRRAWPWAGLVAAARGETPIERAITEEA
jgi:hypothetical protein